MLTITKKKGKRQKEEINKEGRERERYVERRNGRREEEERKERKKGERYGNRKKGSKREERTERDFGAKERRWEERKNERKKIACSALVWNCCYCFTIFV